MTPSQLRKGWASPWHFHTALASCPAKEQGPPHVFSWLKWWKKWGNDMSFTASDSADIIRYRIPVIPPRCCAPTSGFSVQKASTEQPESSALPCRTTIRLRTKQYQTGQRVEEGTLDSVGHQHLSTALLMGLRCSLRGSAVLAQSICQWKDFIPVQCQCSNYSNIIIADFVQARLRCALATPLWCYGYCSLYALVLLSCIQKLCRGESGAMRICCNVEGPPGSAEEGSSPRPIKASASMTHD